jgi:putative flippase GtrA
MHRLLSMTGRAGRHRIGQLVRYGSVSIISTVVGLSVLGTLVATRAISPGWANIVATATGTVPSFELNRRWVWRRTGTRSVTREVGPFCVMSFLGLALSTLTVTAAAAWATRHALAPASRTVLVEAANVAAFGSLWVAQFVVLDRVLFGRPRAGDVRSIDRGSGKGSLEAA